jgi:nucleotide-binding universal stress UspA family protein
MSTTQILLALDESSWSAAASTVGIDLVGKIDGGALSALHVVNVVRPSGNFLKDLPGRLGFEPAIVSEDAQEAASEGGRRVLGLFKRDAETVGVETRTILDQGAVAERVVHHASTADLLVMGFKGETEERFPGQGGGTVAQILETIEVPMLLVPREAQGVTGVALAYDGSVGAKHALASVRRVFGGSRVPVHLVFVDTSGEGGAVLEEAEQALTECVVHKRVVEDPDVQAGLKRAVRASGADLIAVGFRGRSTLKDFFLGSTSEYLALAGGTMVLIAH